MTYEVQGCPSHIAKRCMLYEQLALGVDVLSVLATFNNCKGRRSPKSLTGDRHNPHSGRWATISRRRLMQYKWSQGVMTVLQLRSYSS
mmetsp:Transcript_18807/g.51530  ORF Transcript_18807/g.51530 Transcript_18807/m.51530 type:complete len:88 (-) Transcript_18807:274-537(-)